MHKGKCLDELTSSEGKIESDFPIVMKIVVAGHFIVDVILPDQIDLAPYHVGIEAIHLLTEGSLDRLSTEKSQTMHRPTWFALCRGT